MPYSYADTDHKLRNAGTGARSFDANGNSTVIPGTGALSYDERNRLVFTKSIPCIGRACNEFTSKYNARGERVSSVAFYVHTLTLFSESGQLLSEGDTASTSSSVIYLDSIPVARVNGSVINPIEADHLGSPRVLQKPDGSGTEWTWDLLANTNSGSNAFGEQVPAGKQTFNLRFPGQYADGNGLSYNYFRDYENGTGRYVESDPIGLRGGVSTFGYVSGNPILLKDVHGLAWQCTRPMRGLSLVPHDYLCATNRSGSVVCGGITPAGGAPGIILGPGKDSGEQFEEGDCSLVPGSNKCIDRCIAYNIGKPRPPYGIGPQADDCLEWAADTLWACTQLCTGPKKKFWDSYFDTK